MHTLPCLFLKMIIPKHFISVSNEGITFDDGRLKTLYKWENITNIFSWLNRCYLMVIDRKGTIAWGILSTDKQHRKISMKINNIRETWLANIKEIDSINCYEYPLFCYQEERHLLIKRIIWGIGSGVVFFFLFFFTGDWKGTNIIHDWGSIGLLILGILFFTSGLFGIKRIYRKRIAEVRVQDNNMEIIYETNDSTALNINDIKDYRFDTPNKSSKIIFINGVTINNIDRFSYWPVLRQKILRRVD